MNSRISLRKSLWARLPVASNQPLIRGDFFEGHGAAGVQFLCADANLCAKAELTAIGEAGGGIVIDTGGIDLVEEALGGCGVLGDDALAVTRAIAGNVLKGFVQAIDDQMFRLRG